MKVTGIIDYIGQKNQKTATFAVREIWVTTQGEHQQTMNIQFTNDKCDILNNYLVGQLVEIDINLRGNKYQHPTTGEWSCFNTIKGWRIAAPQPQGYGPNGYHGQGSAVNAYQQQQQVGFQQAPQQGYGSQPQNFNQNPSYGGNQNYGQPQQSFPQQPPQNYGQQHPSGFPPAHNAPQGYTQQPQQPQQGSFQQPQQGFPQQQNFGNQNGGFQPTPDFGTPGGEDDLPF